MNKYKSEASMNVSAQLSKYIVNRARDLYINRLRNQAIQQKSFNITKQYPNQCAHHIIQLCEFEPKYASQTLNQDFELGPPPKCRDINGTSVKTTSASSPRMSVKPYTNCRSTVRHENKDLCMNDSTFRTFLPLISSQEEDQQIQNFRQKKQKVQILQKLFEESQRKQRNKLKQKVIETINNTFTTDFNGDKIQMKPLKYKKMIDPYIMIEMQASLAQERIENKLNPRQFRNTEGVKKISKLSDVNRQQVSKRLSSKISKNNEEIPLRQMQNLINSEKSKKGICLNRRSRAKALPQMMSIKLIK